MIKFKCKLYSCRNAELILILVVRMTNSFICKTIFHYSNLRRGGGGAGLCLTWPDFKKIKLMRQSVIHSFYQTKSDSFKLGRKLLNVESNQSVSQSKL